MELKEYLKQNLSSGVFEGGASGHMKHIIDYDELTLDELKALIYNLFNGRIEDITEKVDGTNIQASMNEHGQVVFIRNKGDLNSRQGGMTVDDMVAKWQGSPNVQKTFVESGKKIEQVFDNLSISFFNPEDGIRVFVNCECLTEGTTNIMPYVSSNVMFHDLWIYENIDGQWQHKETTKKGLDKIEKAAEKVDGAQITPKVIVDAVKASDKLVKWYMARCNGVFKSEKLNYKATVGDYKRARFERWLNDNAVWAFEQPNGHSGVDVLYDRIINGDKHVNLKSLKEMYPGHETDIDDLEKNKAKEIGRYVVKELDQLFLEMSNSVISITKGFINMGHEAEVIKELRKNLEDVVSAINSNDEAKETVKTKLCQQLERFDMLNNEINAAEGIVFRYKGRMMKCTGSFAPLNAIIGLYFKA